MEADLRVTEERSIPDALAAAVRRFTDRPALAEYRHGAWQLLTFRELERDVRRLAAGLIHLGVATGDRLALVGGNSAAWSTGYFAILLAGGVVVPLDRLQTPAEWSDTLARAEVSVVLGAAHELEALGRHEAGEPARRRVIRFAGEPTAGELTLDQVQRLAGEPRGDFPARAPEDLAVIIFTSGTTGQSKGVMLSHRNIVTDARAMLAVVGVPPSARFLSVLPLSHAYESTCGLVAPLLAGASVYFARSFTPSEIVADLSSSGATFLLAVPLLVEKIVAGVGRALTKRRDAGARLAHAVWRGVTRLGQPWRSALGRAVFGGLKRRAGLAALRYLVCGGAPLGVEYARAIEALGIGFLQGYGLSETSPVATLNRPGAVKVTSVGKPLPGVEVAIAEPDADGSGEILIRGPIVMKGYWKDSASTSKVLREGWLATGDRGRMDRGGYLYITGRSKLVIITPGGKNISPEEVELALLKSPFIAECLVFGAPARHGSGEEVVARIHPHEEYLNEWRRTRGDPGDLHALLRREIDRATAHLAHYKHVVHFEIEPEPFKKTTSHKIKRHLHVPMEGHGST